MSDSPNTPHFSGLKLYGMKHSSKNVVKLSKTARMNDIENGLIGQKVQYSSRRKEPTFRNIVITMDKEQEAPQILEMIG